MELIKVKAERGKPKGWYCGCICLLICALSFQQSSAQTFAEWFSQGKTQIKYLTQQIAALTAFESSMKQGYSMLRSEWGAIGNFKNGEFGLHQSYYSSLSQVNPVVKSSTDMASIQAEQQSIISRFNSITGMPGLTAEEQAYISSLQQNIIKQCSADLGELQKVLTAGVLQMSDDERIKRINQLTAAIKDKYVFTCTFANQVRVLALQRARDTDQLQSLQQYYGTNN